MDDFGFHDIPIIAIVLVGIFTKRVPALAAKIVIVFHLLAYGSMQFLFKDFFPIHFLHLYAILFAIEVSIMLSLGAGKTSTTSTLALRQVAVDLTPWAYAVPCSVTLLSSVICLYLIFSSVGAVGGFSEIFKPIVIVLLSGNAVFWFLWRRRVLSRECVAL